jgi:broad specificity phosphatase PhoE
MVEVRRPSGPAPRHQLAGGRTLLLLRHGRTAWNASKRIQGQLDPPLDEVGLSQATAVAPVIAKLAPAQLWCSDLARARQTADAVAEVTGLRPTLDARLRETMLGERQGLTHEQYAALDADEFARFLTGDWDDIPGAETAAEVADRTSAALADLTHTLEPGETGLAVSHGAAIRIAVARLLGWSAAQVGDVRGMANCGWAVLTERPDARWALTAYNRIA